MSQILRAAFPDASDSEGALNHFNHRHALLRLHLRWNEGIKCNFCNVVISGRGYACNQHCDYYLHDLFYNHEHDYICHFNCAVVSEYGMENHSMGQPCGDAIHFTHRHALKEYNSAKPLAYSLCDIGYLTGYFCSSCNYFIDKICFSVPSIIQHMSHPQNPLKLTCSLNLLNEELICPGCSGNIQTSRGMTYYFGAPCIFIMNRQCAGAPRP
ncbi:hypothetical protein RDI58_027237 [Solanum bulbocastanum]|uniref:DC1 domain-containing protein n=1 Tax=Solanum bulbocastanum TaxID=147425 RepID=A0AAN8T0F0_SOLBU